MLPSQPSYFHDDVPKNTFRSASAARFGARRLACSGRSSDSKRESCVMMMPFVHLEEIDVLCRLYDLFFEQKINTGAGIISTGIVLVYSSAIYACAAHPRRESTGDHAWREWRSAHPVLETIGHVRLLLRRDAPQSYPVYDLLRDASPVLRVPPPFDAWMIFDYEGVKRALTDHDTFSSRVPGPPNWFLFFDPPRHTKRAV